MNSKITLEEIRAVVYLLGRMIANSKIIDVELTMCLKVIPKLNEYLDIDSTNIISDTLLCLIALTYNFSQAVTAIISLNGHKKILNLVGKVESSCLENVNLNN